MFLKQEAKNRSRWQLPCFAQFETIIISDSQLRELTSDDTLGMRNSISSNEYICYKLWSISYSL